MMLTMNLLRFAAVGAAAAAVAAAEMGRSAENCWPGWMTRRRADQRVDGICRNLH